MSFAVETTLASRSLALDGSSGFDDPGIVSSSIFFWTPSPEFSIERVAEAGPTGRPFDPRGDDPATTQGRDSELLPALSCRSPTTGSSTTIRSMADLG